MSWIITADGGEFDFRAIEQQSIDFGVIAHSLSHQCRFNGHTREFYSVAEHSVRVMRLVSQPNRLAALLHDAAEAYVGDMVTPLKKYLPLFSTFEDMIQQRIFAAAGLDIGNSISREIKTADLIMLATERRDLLVSRDDARDWSVLHGISPMPQRILPWSAEEARQMWLSCFQQLTGRAA